MAGRAEEVHSKAQIAVAYQFINHPKIGTVKVPQTIPKWNSKRYKIINDFVHKLLFYGYIESFAYSECKKCGKSLLNPQSILMHIGTFCKKSNPKKDECTEY